MIQSKSIKKFIYTIESFFSNFSVYISLVLVVIGLAIYTVVLNSYKKDKQLNKVKLLENKNFESHLIGKKLSSFILKDFNGHAIEFPNKRYKSYLFLFFSNFRCDPCIENLKYLQSIYSKYESYDLMVVAITVEPHIPAIRRFANRFNLEYPILMDPDLLLKDKLGLTYLTCFILVDSNCTIFDTWSEFNPGSVDAETLKEKIEFLLK